MNLSIFYLSIFDLNNINCFTAKTFNKMTLDKKDNKTLISMNFS